MTINEQDKLEDISSYVLGTTIKTMQETLSSNQAYWLYEDAQILLNQVYPAGTKVRIQIDTTDVLRILLLMEQNDMESNLEFQQRTVKDLVLEALFLKMLKSIMLK